MARCPDGPGGVNRMRRRACLRLALVPVAASLAGCGGRDGVRGTTSADLDPSEVTTTGGEDVEVRLGQVILGGREDGPRIHYRLRNDGDGDATVEVRTVLAIRGGGTYEASAVVDVPAGGEVFVEYTLVRYEELSSAEEEAVRRGETTFETYVDGERREGL